MAQEILKKLGFGDKEIVLYLAILEAGKTTASELAKITKINRTTVYAVAKELIEKGVIAEDSTTPVAHLVALPLKELKGIVWQEELELNARKKLVDEAIAELKPIAAKTQYAIPKMVFISEGELEKYLYRQTPVWAKSMKERDGVWWGFQDPSLVEHYEEWIDWANKTKIQLNLLSNNAGIEDRLKGKYPQRHIKYLKEGSQQFTSTIWIVGDYIVMVNTSQRPHYLVEIHDEAMAHNMRELFKGLWGSRISHYEGMRGINQLDEDIVAYLAKLPASKREVLEYARVEDVLSGKFSNLESTSDVRHQLGARVRQIAPDTKAGRGLVKRAEEEYYRKILLTPDRGQSKDTIYLIVGDRVAYYFLDEDSRPAATLIEDKAQADIQREMFEHAWSSMDK